MEFPKDFPSLASIWIRINYKENTECGLHVKAIVAEKRGRVDMKELSFSSDMKMPMLFFSLPDTQNEVIDIDDKSRLMAA